MVIKTIKLQKASSCTYILTPRLRTCRVVDLKLPIYKIHAKKLHIFQIQV